MTVRTMPVRQQRDAQTEARPVLWQGMIWVTWRQHRALVTSVLGLFIVAAITMLVVGRQIHHDYGILTSCRPAGSPGCRRLSDYFNGTDWHEGNGIHVAVLAAPVLLAMFAGPPLVAGELEHGTFRYAWTQGIGRVRWTAAKLAVLAIPITLGALVLSQECSWMFAPFLKTQNISVLSPAAFGTSGVVYAAWALTALCLGTFLGTLLRRIIPAIAVTLALYLALAALTWFYLRGHYPVTTFWPMQLFETAWLLALSALLAHGTIRLVRHHAA